MPAPNGVAVSAGLQPCDEDRLREVDYPDDGVSPTGRARTDDGWTLVWHYDRVVSGRPIGLIMPRPAQPRAVASRITFFAPVSLLFFFAALIILTTTGGVKLHPMHYLFLAAAFFAFDLLLAYLADQIDINARLRRSPRPYPYCSWSATCVVVIGWNRVLLEIAISQFVFLVLFSYSFFFEGLTGLAITIGSVVTLAFFMWKTAGVDWNEVFARPAPGAPVPAAPPHGPPIPVGADSVRQ